MIFAAGKFGLAVISADWRFNFVSAYRNSSFTFSESRVGG